MTESYLLPTRVECYAGSRADEEPRALWLEERRLAIPEIIDRWYQSATDPVSPPVEYYRVRTEDGRIRLLRRETDSRAWYLVEPVR